MLPLMVGLIFFLFPFKQRISILLVPNVLKAYARKGAFFFLRFVYIKGWRGEEQRKREL